jgi:hypothetical protein
MNSIEMIESKAAPWGAPLSVLVCQSSSHLVETTSRLWWTVKHQWVYLRPAANGIEQKRSLGEFFDWYNLRRPHQALGWPTPDEAYLNQYDGCDGTGRLTPCRGGAVDLWTVGCADPRLTAPARSPMDKPGKRHAFPPPCPPLGGCPQASQHPQQDRMNLISGKDQTSSQLPALSLFLPGTCPNTRHRCTQPFRSDAAHHELTVDPLEICAEPRLRRGRAAKRDQTAALGMRKLPQVRAVQDSADLSAAGGAMPAGLRRPAT